MTIQEIFHDRAANSRLSHLSAHRIQCGNDTVVSGDAFEVVSNPMSSMEQTQCSSCGAMFPISDFEWSDTGEKLSDYYARHTQNATELQRFLCSKKFMVAVIVICILATETGRDASWAERQSDSYRELARRYTLDGLDD